VFSTNRGKVLPQLTRVYAFRYTPAPLLEASHDLWASRSPEDSSVTVNDTTPTAIPSPGRRVSSRGIRDWSGVAASSATRKHALIRSPFPTGPRVRGRRQHQSVDNCSSEQVAETTALPLPGVPMYQASDYIHPYRSAGGRRRARCRIRIYLPDVARRTGGDLL